VVLGLAATGDAEAPVALAELNEPRPGSADVIVEQRVISLNRGEARALPTAPPGTVLGWDIAGVVAEPAADGSGPAQHSWVIGVGDPSGGGWAQRVSVPSRNLAVVPDDLDLEAASVLPIAGLTALWALSTAGPILGKRVFITGAAGGVGRLAVQLAHCGGAHVTAAVRDEQRAAGLRALGADEVVFENERDEQRFDLVLESIGGESLAASLHRIAEGGTVVLFGNSSDSNPVLDVEFYNRSRGAQLYAFNIMYELPRRNAAVDLLWLAEEMLAGRLDPQISRRASWREASDVLRALTEREINGKAVLHVD
jgi:NADPH2:quinone reductase